MSNPTPLHIPHPAAYQRLWTPALRRSVRGVLMLDRAARAIAQRDPDAARLLTHRAACLRRDLNEQTAGVWLSHVAQRLQDRPEAAAPVVALLDRLDEQQDERRRLRYYSGYAPERRPWHYFHERTPASIVSRANASWSPPNRQVKAGFEDRLAPRVARVKRELAQAAAPPTSQLEPTAAPTSAVAQPVPPRAGRAVGLKPRAARVLRGGR